MGNKGHRFPKEKYPSYGNRGKKFTLSHKKKLSESKLGNKNPAKRLEVRKKISAFHSNKKLSEKTKEKIRIALTGNKNHFYGKKHTIKARKNNSIKHKEWWKNPENRKKILNDDALEKRLKGLFKRPTSLEQDFINFFEQNKLPFVYCGDGSLIIGFKNPDFYEINGKKICIETYNRIFPPRKKNWSINKIKHFERYGWKCMVIEKNQLNNPETLVKEIRNWL